MEDWLSYHLYYHEDLSRAVLGFVHPAVFSLLSAGWIDRFFFVRYGLGGPHVRLRLRPAPGHAPLIDRAVRGSAEAFLSRSPSTARLDPEALQRQTQAMLAGDPHETDAAVYPDNTLIARPFRPEVARYGGPDLLLVSLDFFTVSSVAAIDFLVRSGAEPRSRQLILALRLLLAQALCFAIDEEELLALLSYGVESWGEAALSILAKGDRVFAAQPDAFRGIFRQEISDQLSTESRTDGLGPVLGEAARLLSQAVGRGDLCDRPTRKRIGVSQLHMTATRLGLGNLEEVYISRLLSAAAALLEEDPEARAHLRDALALPARSPSLGDLLPRVFAALPAWDAVDSAA
jgi:hypothetical protein